MQPHPTNLRDEFSAASVFAALQGRLPPADEQVASYSEIDFFNAQDLKRRLEAGELVIARYIHCWQTARQRASDFLVDWTYGFMGALLAVVLIAGPLKKLIGGVFDHLGSGSAIEALSLFGLSALIGLGLAIGYGRPLPRSEEQSVTVLHGGTRELIYACGLLVDKPVDQLVRVPFSELIVKIVWVAIADSQPSSLAVCLCPDLPTRGMSWAHLYVASVEHRYHAPLPKDLAQKAEDFARVLGVRYEGLDPEW